MIKLHFILGDLDVKATLNDQALTELNSLIAKHMTRENIDGYVIAILGAPNTYFAALNHLFQAINYAKVFESADEARDFVDRYKSSFGFKGERLDILDNKTRQCVLTMDLREVK